MTAAYRGVLLACVLLGVLRGALAALTITLEPSIATDANLWGIPRWAPLVASVALAIGAAALAARSGIVWAAIAAVYGAGAWAFATPALGGWWWFLAPVAVLAAWPIAVERARWSRQLCRATGALVALGAVCSLFRDPAAVAAAGAIIYTASVALPAWATWQLHRRHA